MYVLCIFIGSKEITNFNKQINSHSAFIGNRNNKYIDTVQCSKYLHKFMRGERNNCVTKKAGARLKFMQNFDLNALRRGHLGSLEFGGREIRRRMLKKKFSDDVDWM